MVQDQKERLMDLYEKGVLTKEEARACFLELEEETGLAFLEEKAGLGFTLPSFKVFSSNRLKQEFSFADIEAVTMRVVEGSVSFLPHSEEKLILRLAYPQQEASEALSNLYIENGHLSFETRYPCKLQLYLPKKWMSVLNLEIGQASARLDYLPFEDISIRSQSDKKQQDIRLTSQGKFSQYLSVEVAHAAVQIQVPKPQAVRGKIESKHGECRCNHRRKQTPYFCEKKGENPLQVRIQTQDSPIVIKGVKDVS